MSANQVILATIYDLYAAEVSKYPYACHQGCAACCTQSVTMTGLEGELLLAYLAANGRPLPELPPGGGARPSCTTNELAARCLARQEFEAEEQFWSFAPCLFLREKSCSIYPARPFGCRSFGSFSPCAQTGEASLAPYLVTLNTVVMQIIEHLARGGLWGNMFDVLAFLAKGRQNRPGGPAVDFSARLLTAQPLPGLLVPPDERAGLARFIARLEAAGVL